jgi:hypothetical protein
VCGLVLAYLNERSEAFHEGFHARKWKERMDGADVAVTDPNFLFPDGYLQYLCAYGHQEI